MAVDDTYTKALLHGDGADASTTFTDEGGTSWTANGNAQIDTAQSVFGGASMLFDGTGDYLSASDSAIWRLDDGSNSNLWTLEFRVRFNGDPGTAQVGFFQQNQDASHFWALFLDNNNLRIFCWNSGTVFDIQNAWNPAGSQWYHVAVVKNGTSGYMMFIDGTQIGTTQTDTDPMLDFTGGAIIGDYVDGSSTHHYLNGWIDELRISKGVARWTANFTPPNVPYGQTTAKPPVAVSPLYMF